MQSSLSALAVWAKSLAQRKLKDERERASYNLFSPGVSIWASHDRDRPTASNRLMLPPVSPPPLVSRPWSEPGILMWTLHPYFHQKQPWMVEGCAQEEPIKKYHPNTFSFKCFSDIFSRTYHPWMNIFFLDPILFSSFSNSLFELWKIKSCIWLIFRKSMLVLPNMIRSQLKWSGC